MMESGKLQRPEEYRLPVFNRNKMGILRSENQWLAFTQFLVQNK